MSSVLSIILFIVALGLLICLHELGHFLFAKLFGVYCHEFSIGFGPAIVHTRRKGKETFFSLRIIPVGGYVSMYGEEGEELEEGLKLPPERSIEGIKKWKKGVIVSAGILVNAVLAIIFFSISNLCFPISYCSTQVKLTEESTLVSRIKEGDEINFILQDENQYFTWQYTDIDGIIHGDMFAIIDDCVEVNNTQYVLTYTPTTTKKDNNFTDSIRLYKGVTVDYIEKSSTLSAIYKNWIGKENAPAYFPDVTEKVLEPVDVTIQLSLYNNGEDRVEEISLHVENDKFKDLGLYLKTNKAWLPFSTRWENTWTSFGNSSVAVIKGLRLLFTKNGIKNMSGVVGIFSYSSEILTTQTFATYLDFWGLISINLAIFNLLPFPGLDGWQLLVTIIEGVSKKKLPKKFKTVMSFIGMALLIVLMVVIVIFDVKRLI